MTKDIYKTKEEYLNITIESNGNFFALVYTKFHLIGVLSYAESLLEQQVKLSGYICILPHAETGYAIDSQYLERYNISLVRATTSFNKIPTIGKFIINCYKFIANKFIENKFYLVKAMSIDYDNIKIYLDNSKNNKKLKLVSIDEGIGTYMPASYWKRINDLSRGKNNKRKYAQIKVLLQKIMEFPFRPVEKRYIFKTNFAGGIIKNDNVIKSYSDFYTNQYMKIFYNENIENLKRFIDNNLSIALYFSQPLGGSKLYTIEDETTVLRTLQQELLGKGIKLYIKLHPRDEKNKYADCDIPLFEYNLPAELLIVLLKPRCVFGFTSTALATTSVFFNVNAFSIVELLGSKLNTSSLLIGGVTEYRKLLSSYVKFPNNYNNICNILREGTK